jgi:hypothetical protein
MTCGISHLDVVAVVIVCKSELCLLVGRASVCCGDLNEGWFAVMQV